MYRSTLLFLGILVSSLACHSQARQDDSQTLRDLLSEVRQLRQDLQTTTIAAQRAQILIYRLQGQEAAVARSSQRLTEARDQLARVRDAREHTASEIKRDEELADNTENPPAGAKRKELEAVLAQHKSRLESLQNEEQQKQAQEIDAEQQLRAEEDKLSNLHDQLDRLEKALANASHAQLGESQ